MKVITGAYTELPMVAECYMMASDSEGHMEQFAANSLVIGDEIGRELGEHRLKMTCAQYGSLEIVFVAVSSQNVSTSRRLIEHYANAFNLQSFPHDSTLERQINSFYLDMLLRTSTQHIYG